MGSISHHITPLVITSLGTDTNTDTYTLCGQDKYLEARRASAVGQHVPSLKVIVVGLGNILKIVYCDYCNRDIAITAAILPQYCINRAQHH